MPDLHPITRFGVLPLKSFQTFEESIMTHKIDGVTVFTWLIAAAVSYGWYANLVKVFTEPDWVTHLMAAVIFPWGVVLGWVS